ncbi:MAG: hypothetical protein LBP59_01250 [Planctomycetaceae bacterium]|jgi:hypothetical protein|nr:hypothetical protein [Planctomycetaceae bacterium]
MLVIFSCLIFINYSRSESPNINSANTEEELIAILQDKTKWDIDKKKTQELDSNDDVFHAAETLSAIRSNKGLKCLVQSIPIPVIRYYSSPRGIRKEFIVVAVARGTVDSADIELILEQIAQRNLFYKGSICLEVILPYESISVILDDFIARKKREHKNGNITNDNITKQLENIDEVKKFTEALAIGANNGGDDRPKIPANLSSFTLNHPLYKSRQAAIKTNLELAQRILKETKNLTSTDDVTKAKFFGAVDELAKVRAVEAVEVLAPVLLLQVDKEIEGLDKKYISLQKYPVGGVLAKIGIPSIWGLLDEIAKRSDNSDDYRKIACNVMTAILIAKAIPGFVNETLGKYKDNELAQIRLAKLLLLLGEDATKINLLKPQFRNWKSTDGLFETRAKFIAIDKKNNITLEKENGKQTTIDLSELQKIDQNYIKELITIKRP